MVAPLVGMLVAKVAGSALSGSGEGKEKEGGIKSIIDPLGIIGGKDKKESNPIEQLLSMVMGGGEEKKGSEGILGGALSMLS